MGRRLCAVVLAAGEGKRMGSDLPKPLHLVRGRPMVCHVLDALADLAIPGTGPLEVVVVVGHRSAQVTAVVTEQAPAGLVIHFAEQRHRCGTGDAVTAAIQAQAQLFETGCDAMVLPADTPLLRSDTLARLLRAHGAAGVAATVLVARLAEPTGYGRVIRDGAGDVARIVEERDASFAERATKEVNTSIYCFRAELLGPALGALRPSNAQAELYLTDVIGVLVTAGHRVESVLVADPTEVAGVNDPAELAAAEACLAARARLN